MKAIFKNFSLGIVTAFTVVGMSGVGAAYAQSNVNQTLQGNLSALNGSDSTGAISIKMVGDDKVRVMLSTSSASPGLPHAQHLHIGGNNVCPGPDADKNKSGLISTVEGQPEYGKIKISLTTSGDMSPDSALAVERMPKADASGNLSYDRTFALPEGVTQEDLSKAVIVQHGISELFDDKAKYDGETKSLLNEELPIEATVPSSCGIVTSAPSGSVDAGFGSTTDDTTILSIGLGVISLGAAGVVIARRRALS